MTASSAAKPGVVYRLLRLFIDVRPGEAAALGWAFLYFFCVLSSYYVIRPIRDEVGVAGGVENLPWLFTGTLVGMTLANPPFAALVSRLPRAQFIRYTYRFFMANLVLFYLLFQGTSGDVNLWVGRIFFIWTSVFNLFVVSVFWATLVDLFTTDQGKRLFGFIAAGATIGSIVGSSLTAGFVHVLGSDLLLVVSAVLLEAAVFGFGRMTHASIAPSPGRHSEADQPVGGGMMSGLTRSLQSPYLLNISLYMLLFTVLSTFLYFQQASIVDRTFSDRASRTQFFAQVDLAVNTITLIVQLGLTGRILQWLGVGVTLTLLPLLTIGGFVLLGAMPTVAVIVGFQVLRRAGNFAVARPTREILFTALSREDRYKAKSFIDTFVYRAGDQIGAWSFALMGMLGLGVAGVAWAAVPISIVWLLNSMWLGRHQPTRSTVGPEPTTTAAALPRAS